MNRKTRNILLSIYVLALVIMAVGATMAYFTAVKVSSTTAPVVQSTTAVTNYITFKTSFDLNIYATEENFGTGMPSLSSSTYASAEIRVDNAEDVTTLKYNVYLIIDTNEFIYTTLSSTPELLLSIIDPDGVEVTNLESLTYTTVTDNQGIEYSGFDITTLTGTTTLVSSYEISTKTEEYQEWDVTITFVNLPSDQEDNTGKTLSGKLMIEKVE